MSLVSNSTIETASVIGEPQFATREGTPIQSNGNGNQVNGEHDSSRNLNPLDMPTLTGYSCMQLFLQRLGYSNNAGSRPNFNPRLFHFLASYIDEKELEARALPSSYSRQREEPHG